MSVRRNTEKFLVLTGILINSLGTVQAADIVSSRPNLASTKPSLPNNFSDLKAPSNLYLPKLPREVRIESYKPINLKTIEHLIENNNPSLEELRIKIDQTKSLLVAAIASWYPTINLSANGLPQYLEADQFNSSSTDTSSRQWKSTLSIEVKWNLIDPARVPEIAAARDSYEKARASYLIKLRDLRLEAFNRYFKLQSSSEGIRIGKDSVESSEISLRDAKARFKAGIGNRLEILEAETQLSRDKQLLTKKLGEQSINRRSLSEILNLPHNVTAITPSAPKLIGIWDTSLEESIIIAYGFRKELDRLKLDISINNSNANSALAASQPTVSLFNTYSHSYHQGELLAASPDMDKHGSSRSNTVGLSATWKIFDGGKAKARYNYNKQKAKASAANLASKRSLIRKEIEESFYTLRTASHSINSAKREIVASKESLRLARLRFQAGVTEQREVVNNQRDLTDAEVRYSEAITSYNVSLSQLKRRTGINKIQNCKPKEPFNLEALMDGAVQPKTNNVRGVTIPITCEIPSMNNN